MKHRIDSHLKRAFDIAASATGLLLLAPLMLIAAVLLKATSKGPVFFKHRRLGRGRRVFNMYKFRTMVQGARRMGPEFTVADDPRVTPIGRILRKAKIDELPQLFNVLIGDMSIVGPRPQSLSLAEHYSDEDLDFILSIRPGITGPTQLWLRHEEELLAAQDSPETFYAEELLPLKIASDKAYVESRSLARDTRLVTETVRAVARLAPPPEPAEIMDISGLVSDSERRAA